MESSLDDGYIGGVMVDIINFALLVIAIVFIVRFALWSRKRIVMILKLRRLVNKHNGEMKFLRSPFLPTSMNSEKPDIYVKILDTVYLIRLYSGRSKHYMVHFASERFSVRYMKMALRMLASTRRRGTGIAYVESGKAFTVRSKVFVAKPMTIPSELADTSVNTEMILLFNPAPHAVSYVSSEGTDIKVALIGDEIFGMKVYTGSSFTQYADAQARRKMY